MKGVNFLAILAGFVVDNVGSLLLGLVLGSFLPIYDRSQGMYLESIFAAVDQNHVSHPLLIEWISLVGGGFFSLLGGFVAGWIANHDQLKHGLLAGALSTLLAAFLWSSDPAWYNATAGVLTLGLAAVGGYWAQFACRRRRPPPV